MTTPGALPTDLYRAASVRELDRVAIEELRIPGIELMERAGGAAWAALRVRWPACAVLGVLCGQGNNAGDGYVVARLARDAGLRVRLLEVGDPARLGGDAGGARQRFLAGGGTAERWGEAGIGRADVFVDALFGTGLDREVTGAWRLAIEALGASGAPVLSVDLPSGLHADTGRVLGAAVHASLTVTFIGLKQGLFTGAARDYCGELVFDDLAVPSAAYARVAPDARRVTLPGRGAVLGPRARTAHKGAHGHVLVIGGDVGYGGAALLAGEGAARCGAGLVSVGTRAANVAALIAGRPELMCRGVEEPGELAPLLGRASVLAIGPGLGRREWGRKLLEAALDRPLPAVVDADALNALAGGALGTDWGGREDRVYTPHPGEAARLLGCGARDVEADRFAAAQALAERHRGVWILKGAGSLIASAGARPAVCDGGNPGMAGGGTGDVLTGVVAALLAQGIAPRPAAECGVCLHAAAADAAALDGERGLLARDLMPHLRRLASAL